MQIDVFSDGGIQVRDGELYSLKIRALECGPAPDPKVASFAQIGGRGQDNWTEFGRNEIAFIQSLSQNAKIWNWAASPGLGTIYTKRDDVAGTVKWPFVLMSSVPGRPRQIVRAKPYSNSQMQIMGIPRQLNGDYSRFTPENYPGFFLWCPTIYPDGHFDWGSHSEILFLMPIFDPTSGFKQSASSKSYGGLVSTDIFFGKV